MKKISICMTILFLALSFSLTVSAADKVDIKMNGVHTDNNPIVSDVDGRTIEINKSIEKVEANQYIDIKLTVKSTDMNMNPKTGDGGIVVPIALFLIASCGFLVLTRKKSRKSMLSLLLISALLPALSSNVITVQAETTDSKYTTIETFSDEIFESFTFDKVISISAGTSDVIKNNEGKITGIKWNVANANSEQSLVYRLLLNDTVQDNLMEKELNVSGAYLNFTDSGSKITKIEYPDVSIKLTTSESPPPASAFKLIYNANGGIGDDITSYSQADSTITILQNTFTNPDHTFLGWSDSPEGGGIFYPEGDTITLTRDVVLYARWRQSFTVTYDANGQTGSYADVDVSSSSPYPVRSAGDIGISSPTFIFNNWNTAPDGSGTSYSAGQPITVTGDMVLYAQWQVNPPMSFTVTYDANGQTGSYADTDITSGDSYTVKSASNVGISSPTLAFMGWNTASNGSGTPYSPGANIIVTGDLTLYAQWQAMIPD